MSSKKGYVRLPVNHLGSKVEFVIRLVDDFLNKTRVNGSDDSVNGGLGAVHSLARRGRHGLLHNIKALLRHSLRRLAKDSRLGQTLEHIQRMGIRRHKLRQRIGMNLKTSNIGRALCAQKLGGCAGAHGRGNESHCLGRKHGRGDRRTKGNLLLAHGSGPLSWQARPSGLLGLGREPPLCAPRLRAVPCALI